MKKILGLLFSLNALAISSSGKVNQVKYLEGNLPFINFVKNPSCIRNGTTGITAVSTTVTRDGNGAINEVADCSFTLNAVSDSVDWALNPLDEGLYGQNCEARISYKFDNQNTGQTFYFRVKNGASTVAEVEIPNTKGTPSLNVPCGDGTENYTVQVIQTAGSSSQVVHVADVYFGRATNVGSVAQAEFVGAIKYAGASNCIWTTTSTSFGNYSADTDCTTPTVVGAATAPGTKIPAIVFPSLKPGYYLIQASGSFVMTGATDNAAFRISDGTNTTAAVFIGDTSSIKVPEFSGYLNYTAAQSNVTIQVQARSNGGSGSAQIQNQAPSDFEIRVYRFPTSSEIAYRPEQMFSGGSVRYAGVSNCIWSGSGSSFVSFSADTDCNTATTTGAVQAPATKIPGLVVPMLPAGRYLITATGNFTKPSGDGNPVFFRFSDGTNVTGGQRIYDGATTEFSVPVIAGILETSSVQANVTVQVQALNGGAGNFQILNNTTNERFEISIIPLSQNLPAPLLVGSVTSSSTGAERIERVKVMTTCSSSPCTLTSNTPGVTSVTRGGTGLYTINFASGTFSAAPTCTFSGAGGSQYITQSYAHASWTSTAVQLTTWNSVLTAIDGIFDAVCMGPR